MNFTVDGRQAFAYTAAHAIEPAKPTIVFVHGAGLDHSLFGLQSRYFGYHGFNVLAVDLPGHGRSEGPPLPAIGAMADWIFRLLDAQKMGKASVVGHSMGSLVALECAARQPARVERIALLGTGYPMKVGEAFLDAAKRNDPAAYDMETIWGTRRWCRSAVIPIRGCGCTATRSRASRTWPTGSRRCSAQPASNRRASSATAWVRSSRSNARRAIRHAWRGSRSSPPRIR